MICIKSSPQITYALAGDNKIKIIEDRSGIEIDGFLELKGNELTQVSHCLNRRNNY